MKTQLLRLTSVARALLLLAALLLAVPGLRAASANPPDRMTYQGFLVDANGVALGNTLPVNHTVEFRIYDASTGGTEKWGEIQTVTVDKGYFSVMLGDGSELGGAPNVALSTVFQGADASDRFISVKVSSLAGSSEILPRLRLVTSPYAYMATTLPPGAITNGLFAAASITGDKLATNTLTAANFSTNVGLWTANGTNIFRTNGFVGIGTTTPGAPLDVLGQMQVLNNGTIQSHGSKNTFRGMIETSYGPGNDRYGLAQGPAGALALYTAQNVGYIQFGKATGADSFSPQMTIQNNGNVGIGTTTPGSQLHVGSAVAAEWTSVLGTSFRVNGGNLGNTVGNDVPLGSFIYYPSGGNQVSLGIHARKASATAAWNGTAVGLTLDVDNQPGVGGGIWLNNGNVGIGTATPGALLSLGTSIPGSGVKLALYDAPGDTYGLGVVGGGMTFHVANNEKMRITSVGNVGIGTASPNQAKLVVSGGPGASYASVYWAQAGVSTWVGAAANPANQSIYADGFITGLGFISFSDARTKRVEGRSDRARDLATIEGIEVTDYTFVDILAKGSGKYKKVIAQQVEQVYPQAVKKSTDVVPDIYQKAAQKDGWVQLATDLKVGERVKLIGEKEEGIHEVLEVRKDAFRTAFKPATDKVFVYGREVKDFRSVDYEAISMLNVSATQELARKVKAQETELTELRAELAKLRTEKKSLAATVTELQAQDEARESRLARLEQALAKDAKVIQAKATPRLAK